MVCQQTVCCYRTFCISETNNFFIYNSSFVYIYISSTKKDILSFDISEFSDAFEKLMNNEDVSFKSQYILERLSSFDEWFTYNITCDSNNKVNDIV